SQPEGNRRERAASVEEVGRRCELDDQRQSQAAKVRHRDSSDSAMHELSKCQFLLKRIIHGRRDAITADHEKQLDTQPKAVGDRRSQQVAMPDEYGKAGDPPPCIQSRVAPWIRLANGATRS